MNKEMKYTLAMNTYGKHPVVDIEKQRFESLKCSGNILNEALAIEEKYELLISNYVELEKVSIDISVSEMVHDKIDYSDFFDEILILNTKLVNLLTSIRLYKDQLARHVSKCIPNNKNAKTIVESFFTNEFEKNADYRFMEGLRNYVQHYGLPIHGVSTGAKWTDLNNGYLEYSINFKAIKKNFLQDNKFKKEILKEMPEEVNLKASIRSYIESLSSIHDSARNLIYENVDRARKEFETTINEYENIYEKIYVGLHAYAYKDYEKVDEVPVFLNWDNVRVTLIKKNRKLSNLKKRYVTSRIINK